MINGAGEGGSMWIFLNATAPLSISVSPAVISGHLCGLYATLCFKGSVHPHDQNTFVSLIVRGI